MYWLGGPGDDRHDQCAHGGIELSIDETRFVPAAGAPDEFTVSAAGLFLLRTIEHDHSARHPVAEASQLFPHCGFSVFAQPGHFRVLVPGCDTGVDPEVEHRNGLVAIRAPGGGDATVTEREWADAVLGFAAAVEAFYEASPARIQFEESREREGWTAFWDEWRDRVEADRRR